MDSSGAFLTKRGKSTEQIHHDFQPPAGWGAVPVPVYKASTVLFADTAALHRPRTRDAVTYRYGLQCTPGSLTLAARIATLEQAAHCVLVPSGLAAITLTSMALLKPGDEVLLPDNVYGQNRYITTGLLSRLGIHHQFYDPLDAAAFERQLSDRTRLVWLEAAGSITMEFPDLMACCAPARPAGSPPRWTTPGAPAWPSTPSSWRRAWAWTCPCRRSPSSPRAAPMC